MSRLIKLYVISTKIQCACPYTVDLEFCGNFIFANSVKTCAGWGHPHHLEKASIKFWAIIGTPAKRHLNGGSMMARLYPYSTQAPNPTN